MTTTARARLAPSHPASGTPSRRGFTIAEVLVVVGIIALLVALLFPVFGRVRSSARTAKCLSNQRQLTLANSAYAASNKGKWVSPRTDKNGTTYPGNVANQINHCWVKAEGSNVVPSSGTALYEKPEALEQGVLFPYIGNIQCYVSPHEPTNMFASVASNTTTRIRSYSFNACLGTTRPDELPEFDDDFADAFGIPLIKYNTTSVGQITKPSQMMSTIVEDDSVAYNNQGWLILPQTSNWIDWPAPWVPDAIALSYVDGSVQSYALKNATLVQSWATNGHRWQQPADAVAGFATDWKFFRDRLNPGVIPNSTYEFGN
jgi:prepilin-type N-terminal cleavage/methylation domain-containing protein